MVTDSRKDSTSGYNEGESSKKAHGKEAYVALLCGIDIGGTKIALGLGDREGHILAQDRIAVDPSVPARELLQQVAERLKELAAGRPIEAAGVGVPSPMDPETGVLIKAPNLPGWDGLPIKAIFEEALHVPVLVENDANAAAYGEYRYGAGRGCKNMVYVTVSTGVGGGVVVDGKLVRGVRGAAGEIGHQTIDPNGPLCGCGNHGCLEAFASGTAIARRAQEGIDRGEETVLKHEKVTTFAISKAVREGDPFAKKVWQESIEYLAIGIGNVIVMLAPERIVIGGGVANVGDLLFQPLREAVKSRVRVAPVDRIEIVPAGNVNDAGLLGALAVASEIAP